LANFLCKSLFFVCTFLLTVALHYSWANMLPIDQPGLARLRNRRRPASRLVKNDRQTSKRSGKVYLHRFSRRRLEFAAECSIEGSFVLSSSLAPPWWRFWFVLQSTGTAAATDAGSAFWATAAAALQESLALESLPSFTSLSAVSWFSGNPGSLSEAAGAAALWCLFLVGVFAGGVACGGGGGVFCATDQGVVSFQHGLPNKCANQWNGRSIDGSNAAAATSPASIVQNHHRCIDTKWRWIYFWFRARGSGHDQNAMIQVKP
jgi:hypothetical protein